MKVRHLNLGTMRPLLLGAEMVCHSLLVETEQGLVLVDTGFGTHEVLEPREHMPWAVRAIMRPRLAMEETAAHQVVDLGYELTDVRHIVLTHLDFDHSGGLRDFPHATVHVLADELTAARNPVTRNEKQRYPAVQRAGVDNWATHTATGEPWFGFEAVRDIPGLPDDILLVPLIGHTRGHTGVAVKGDDKWLLHAGDAYFHRADMASPPKGPALLNVFQKQVQVIAGQRLSNQDRLRRLVAEHADEVDVFCAHDPVELTSRVAPGATPSSRT
ncbi:MBL fold metallo-hydrolase [Lentzea sp. NBRC 105346]|uniref:MBL fold metallo-hydrolase n=1 Tax=Lentzea sp. NBRC 105346 TaxID=3032205 RepID=UPI0024A090EF|nr:MBL fold metallo-hydrolase [Lentzea sp. NBRC 105346]GLZ34375.1 MBL fold metallo-hydrolase [Lentzea sp. NBRC 105346]